MKTTFRDDRAFGYTLDELSVHSYSSQIEKSNVAINNWGGWFDASTADAIIKTFLTLKNFQRAVIGPWNHGATQNASPYHAATSPRVMQSFEWLRFFDHYLKGIDTGLDSDKRLFYFTVGEERWKVTNTWPVAGTHMVRWFFNANNLLSTKQPDARSTEDRYTINFEATTGEKNRWHTQVGGDVIYPDRAEEDKKLLTYTSEPLEADVEITGHPIVSLFITSTHTDGALRVAIAGHDKGTFIRIPAEGTPTIAVQRKSSIELPVIKK